MPSQARRINEAIQDAFEQDVRGTVTRMVAELREATPIDTTTASRSWIPAFANSLFGGSDATFSREDTTPEAQASRQTAGLALVATWKVGDGNIVVSNALDYIEELNAGASPQAPAGFADLAVARAVSNG